MGNIYSFYKKRILKLHKGNNGYLYVSLKGNENKYCTVHRLVAKVFVPNPNNFEFVNHIDENKSNNIYTNLEWCTKAYNNHYNNKHLRCCKKIIQYDLNGNFIKEWNSAREASRTLKIQYKNISAVCRGKRNKCGNFIWKFKEVKNG